MRIAAELRGPAAPGLRSYATYIGLLTNVNKSGLHSATRVLRFANMTLALPRRPNRKHERAPSSLVIHNVVVAGRRTSVRLEPVMWEALHDIARRLEVTIHDLVTQIERSRTASSLTAAIRVFIVDFYRAAALLVGQSRGPQSLRDNFC
jgi:predicted DNA-binding ribbon-helix-helix protein